MPATDPIGHKDFDLAKWGGPYMSLRKRPDWCHMVWRRTLVGHDITCSVSAVGSYYDNADAESFFGLLKRERVNRRRYSARDEARADVFEYIEVFYNPRKRRKLEQLRQATLN